MTGEGDPGSVAPTHVVGARIDGNAPADWQDRVASVPGVRIVGRSRTTLQVQAAPEAVTRLRSLFGDGLRVEDAVRRSF